MAAGTRPPKYGDTWSTLGMSKLMVGRDARGGLPYSAKGSVEAMTEGYCGAAITEANQLYTAMWSLGNKVCSSNLGVTATGMFETQPLALPVRSALAPYISLALRDYVKTHSFLKALTDAKAQLPIACPDVLDVKTTVGDEGRSYRDLQTKTRDVSFFLIMTGLCCILGLFMAFFPSLAVTDYGEAGGCI